MGLKEENKGQSNFEIILDKFKTKFPKDFKLKVDSIGEFVKNYIIESGYNVKFLNSCATGYAGVRTKDQIIICSPSNMETMGDFIYTIFHEMRHEDQMTKFNLENPWDGDLEDIENLSEKYLQLELDADRFAKSMIAKLILKTNLPIDIAKKQFYLSDYIEKYPTLSKWIKNSFIRLVDDIKDMRSRGEEFSDIQDHPNVKKHLKNLENFI
jgi:hypothetical protein